MSLKDGAKWSGLCKHLERELVQVIPLSAEEGEFRAGDQRGSGWSLSPGSRQTEPSGRLASNPSWDSRAEKK